MGLPAKIREGRARGDLRDAERARNHAWRRAHGVLHEVAMANARRDIGSLAGAHGAYLVGRRLGAGGVGVVYDGVCVASGREIAIKFLHRERRRDAEACRRFADEALVGTIVTSPNVVAVLDSGRTPNGDLFFVMERSHGTPLGLRIEREGAFSVERAVAITRGILSGLAAVHDLGVVHADLKSDNVMLETTGEHDHVQLIDFGLACVQLGNDAHPAPRHPQWLSGTPEYMAPEVIRGEGATFASDLYGVGIILYELLTGTTPFAGGSSTEIMARHLHDEVVPPSLRTEQDLPAALDEVVLQVLDKCPTRRFRDARAFELALAAIRMRQQRAPRLAAGSMRLPRPRTAPTLVARPHGAGATRRAG